MSSLQLQEPSLLDDFEQRFLAGRAAFSHQVTRGDADLNPGMTPTRNPLTPASVLVPIIVRNTGLTMLLTRRTDHLHDHAGQISFPGGRWEKEDENDIVTALRESEEEIGLDRKHVRVIGKLHNYVTRTGFSVTPVVGLIEPPFETIPDPFEVAEIFEVPLDFLTDRSNHIRMKSSIKGVDRHFFAMPYGDYYIWGATAGMIVNFVDIMDMA